MWADTMSSKFSDSLCDMLLYEQSKLSPGEYINYDKATVSWHELGRNQLVENMLGDWLLMLDTDHVFKPDLLERLMRVKKKYNAQVISGIYCYKFPPHQPVLNMWKETEKKEVSAVPIMNWDRDVDILQVGTTPGGCLLVDKEVFQKILSTFNTNPFSIQQGLSEDYSFCFRCKQLGIPVYVAPQVECHHMVPTVLSVKDYISNEPLLKVQNGVVVE